jgi:hypothetical protein
MLIANVSANVNESVTQKKPVPLCVTSGNIFDMFNVFYILYCILHFFLCCSDPDKAIPTTEGDESDERIVVEAAPKPTRCDNILLVVKGSIGCRSEGVRVMLNAEEALQFMEADKHNQSHFIVQRYIPDLCQAEYRFYVKWFDMVNSPHLLVKTSMKCKEDHTMDTTIIDVQHLPLHRLNIYQSPEDVVVMELAPPFIQTIVDKLREASYLRVDVTPILRLDIFLYEGRLFLNEIEFDFDMCFFSSCHHDPLIKDFGGMSFYNMCCYWSNFIQHHIPAVADGETSAGTGAAVEEYEEKYDDEDDDDKYPITHMSQMVDVTLTFCTCLLHLDH